MERARSVSVELEINRIFLFIKVYAMTLSPSVFHEYACVYCANTLIFEGMIKEILMLALLDHGSSAGTRSCGIFGSHESILRRYLDMNGKRSVCNQTISLLSRCRKEVNCQEIGGVHLVGIEGKVRSKIPLCLWGGVFHQTLLR